MPTPTMAASRRPLPVQSAASPLTTSWLAIAATTSVMAKEETETSALDQEGRDGSRYLRIAVEHADQQRQDEEPQQDEED